MASSAQDARPVGDCHRRIRTKTNVKTTVKTHIAAHNAHADTASAGTFACTRVVPGLGTMSTLQIDVEGGSGSSG
jgi:hypothetical protein